MVLATLALFVSCENNKNGDGEPTEAVTTAQPTTEAPNSESAKPNGFETNANGEVELPTVPFD